MSLLSVAAPSGGRPVGHPPRGFHALDGALVRLRAGVQALADLGLLIGGGDRRLRPREPPRTPRAVFLLERDPTAHFA